ncbi:hypothetical protein MHBO_001099 [Bonamia ostreae]|uniref:Uncharacterized protein n=1 Tax=Bonamia ostreae TaxID=126728 RepID=A0ABV2AHU5_9EUKA
MYKRRLCSDSDLKSYVENGRFGCTNSWAYFNDFKAVLGTTIFSKENNCFTDLNYFGVIPTTLIDNPISENTYLCKNLEGEYDGNDRFYTKIVKGMDEITKVRSLRLKRDMFVKFGQSKNLVKSKKTLVPKIGIFVVILLGNETVRFNCNFVISFSLLLYKLVIIVTSNIYYLYSISGVT